MAEFVEATVCEFWNNVALESDWALAARFWSADWTDFKAVFRAVSPETWFWRLVSGRELTAIICEMMLFVSRPEASPVICRGEAELRLDTFRLLLVVLTADDLLRKRS
jgi:hypothetical protein